MTPPGRHVDPPCSYAKAIMWLLAVIGGLTVFLTPYLVGRVDSNEDRSRANERALVELQADMKYVRIAVDDIKRAVK